MKKGLILLFFYLCTSSGFQVNAKEKKASKKYTIETKVVEYKVEGKRHVGFLAIPKDSKKKAGVLVVHEWWGHNEYAKKRAKMLAEDGYTALALDMYGDGKTAGHPKDAGAFSQKVNQDWPLAEKKFLTALNFLKEQPTVVADKVVAIGYCFGGSIVINMARSGMPVKGVASFHGGLGNLRPIKGDVKAEFLVFNGKADVFVKSEEIELFKEDMDKNKMKYTFFNLEGAKHSFTNPDADIAGKKFKLPLAYNKKADKKSWNETKKFLNRLLQ